MKNYYKSKKNSLIFNYYAYIDTQEFRADELFVQERVRVEFGETGRPTEDCPYRVVMCRIFKWDDKKFLRALKRLENIMLLSGDSGYLEFMDRLSIKSDAEK